MRRKPTDVRPHYSTRRDAKVSAVIVGINETFPQEQMNWLLALLQGEEEGLILASQSPTRSRPVLSKDMGVDEWICFWYFFVLVDFNDIFLLAINGDK